MKLVIFCKMILCMNLILASSTCLSSKTEVCDSEEIDIIPIEQQRWNGAFSQDSIFLINYRSNGKIDSKAFSLRSKKENVPLEILQRTGTKILLKPSRKLIIGREYTLFNNGTVINRELKAGKYSWKIEKPKGKRIALSIKGSPQYLGFSVGSGCAGNTSANFNMNIQGDYFVLAELTDVETGSIQTDFPRVFSSRLSLIMKECFDGYDLKTKTDYKARFKVISIDGKESEFSEYLNFRSPDSFESLPDPEIEKVRSEYSKPKPFWKKVLHFFGVSH